MTDKVFKAVAINLTDSQLYFLRLRYGKRKQAATLIKVALAEIVSMEAQKLIDNEGYAPIEAQDDNP